MMNHLLAKISRSKQLYKLIADKIIYDDVVCNTNSYVDYDPDHNLDEDCWFQVTEFSKQDYCLDFLKKDFDSKELNQIDKKDFHKIKYIVSIQKEIYYFQKVTPSFFLRKKLLNFGENIFLEENKDKLIINSLPDAIYFKSEDILIFRNLSSISSIFKGIDTLYKEATDAQVTQFLSNKFIRIKQNFSVTKVSKPNRKRIAMAMDTLGNLDENSQQEIIQYINDYCADTLIFNESDNLFDISTDDELKNLLYGIEQRFYTTPVGKEKRLANSIVKLN